MKSLGPLIIGILAVTLTMIAVQTLFKPATVTVQNSTTLCKADLTNFDWSGQNEGETVLVKDPSSSFMYTPPFNRFSLTRGIDEATRRLGGRIPELPTLLPEGIKFADVYVGRSS